jgi:energy-coupling factor transporter ATP-binding protein EcfA2
MTVRESLVFAARMRLRPYSIQDSAKIEFAGKIIKLLDLNEFADMLVGDEASGEGLPKHARKRLTVGVELASNPSILFADEPTSGLDSLSASVVVASLERAARQEGLTVVCTIHQPSRSVFESFDNLLLLRKGGVCVYNGRITNLDQYMQSAPNGEEYAIPDEVNPADHILEVFCGPLGEKQDWASLFKKSDMANAASKSFDSCGCSYCQGGEICVDSQPQSFMSELYIVSQRQLLAHWRTPTYMAIRFWWTVVANIMTGAIYFQASTKSDDAFTNTTNIIGAIFFYVNIGTMSILSAAVPLSKYCIKF